MPLLGGQELENYRSSVDDWKRSYPNVINTDSRVIPQDVYRRPSSSFPDLQPRVPIYITERDIADMDRRDDNIERMEKIVAAQQAAKNAALQQAAQVRTGLSCCCPIVH